MVGKFLDHFRLENIQTSHQNSFITIKKYPTLLLLHSKISSYFVIKLGRKQIDPTGREGVKKGIRKRRAII